MDPQIFGPIWLLYRDIESSVTIELLVFVAGFYCSMQFFFATNFDNVTSEFYCSSLVFIVIGMSCVATQNLFATQNFFATNFSFLSAFGNCQDINFFVATSIFPLQLVYSITTGFLWFLNNFLTKKKKFATNFSSLVLATG